jgi:hypothetical protein
MDKVAVVIVNYNMPERADALAEHIKAHTAWEHDIILVDNGSDITKPAKNTTLALKWNVQTTNGWMAGLDYADALAAYSGAPYFAYWFLITSAEFIDNTDVLTPMAEFLKLNPSAVGVHPSLSRDTTTSWDHLITRGGWEPRETWMIDNIASLYRSDWFDRLGRFDRNLIYGWGIDLETCWKARQQNCTLWVDERVRMKKVTDIGYAMNRMNMTDGERKVKAGSNMCDILSKRYGVRWREMMYGEGVDERLK